MHFGPAAMVFGLSNGAQGTLLSQFLFSSLFLSHSISSGIFWINRRYNCDEGICFPNNSCYGNR